MRWLFVSIALLGAVSARPAREALCSYGTSNYSLSWEYDELSNDVVFHLTATSNAHNFWTGVYFGEEEPFDAIGVFVRNGQIGLVDAYIPAGTDDLTVVADDLNNVQSLQFDMVEGRLTAEFARSLNSHDDQDFDISKCSTFFFPDAEEINRSGQVTIPNMSMSRRVCDIKRKCPARRGSRRQEQFKREENQADAAVAAEAAPEPAAAIVEAEPEAELAIEKKEAPAAPTCNYDFEGSSVNWRLEGEQVIFSVSQPNKKGKWYSAFGVGESMENLKAIVAFTDNGKLQKSVAIQSAGYESPKTLEFEPAILSTGAEKGYSNYEISASKADIFGDVDFSGCVTLQIGLYIGKFSNNFSILKHQKTPVGLHVCGWDRCEKQQHAERTEQIEASGLEEIEGSAEESAPLVAATEQPKNDDALLFNPFSAPTEQQPDAVAVAEPAAAEPAAAAQEEQKTEESPAPAAAAPVEEAVAVVATEAPKPEEPAVEQESPKAEEPKIETTEAPKKQEEEIEGSGDAAPIAAEEQPKEEEKKIDELLSTPRPSMQEMEAEIAAVAATTVVVPLVNGECSADHKDLKVCTSYFGDYLEKVEEWAKNHEQTLGSQMWKACTLLSEVKHVPNMCCTIFRDTCAEHIKI